MKYSDSSNKLIWIIVVLILGYFVWFQVRPSIIKSQCGNYAKDQVNERWKEQRIQTSNEAISYTKAAYDLCLHEKGL